MRRATTLTANYWFQRYITVVHTVKHRYILTRLMCFSLSMLTLFENESERMNASEFSSCGCMNECCYEADHLRRIRRTVAEITHVLSVILIQNNSTLYWRWIRSEFTNLSSDISDKMLLGRICDGSQMLKVLTGFFFHDS